MKGQIVNIRDFISLFIIYIILKCQGSKVLSELKIKYCHLDYVFL